MLLYARDHMLKVCEADTGILQTLVVMSPNLLLNVGAVGNEVEPSCEDELIIF